VIEGFLLLGLAVIAAVCVFALGGRLSGRRFVVLPPSRLTRPDPAHRQAIHHFASGVLPPWR
jgi:hypothetical protein